MSTTATGGERVQVAHRVSLQQGKPPVQGKVCPSPQGAEVMIGWIAASVKGNLDYFD
jgi:hypothetical protein